MPYRLQKKPKHDLYWVVNKETKVKHSKEPISKEKAEAQKRILEQAEGIAPVVKGPKRRRPKGFENAHNMVKPGRLIHLGQVRIPGAPPRGTMEVSDGRVPDPTPIPMMVSIRDQHPEALAVGGQSHRELETVSRHTGESLVDIPGHS